MLVLGVDDVLVLVLRLFVSIRVFFSPSTHCTQRMCMSRGGLLLVHASEVGKLDGQPAGVTEVMSPTDSGVSPQAHEVIRVSLVLVLGDDIHCRAVACACGVEACGVDVGRSVAAVVVAVVAAIVAAAVREGIVRQEGTGVEPGRLAAAAVAVGQDSDT